MRISSGAWAPCGYGLVVERHLAKVEIGVRFPVTAQNMRKPPSIGGFLLLWTVGEKVGDMGIKDRNIQLCPRPRL